MTPEERAAGVYETLAGVDCPCAHDEAAIAEAIRIAVDEEREACALALDYLSAELPADCPDEGVRTVGNVLRTAARMIRARKESWPCRR
jgi:hypothetical protein